MRRFIKGGHSFAAAGLARSRALSGSRPCGSHLPAPAAAVGLCPPGTTYGQNAATPDGKQSCGVPRMRGASIGVGGGGGGRSLYRVTRPLLRERKGLSKSEVVDLMSADGYDCDSHTHSLDLNLFEDPTGGLAASPAEELTTTEIDAQTRLLTSSYSEDLFHILYTPLVDIIHILVQQGVLPDTPSPPPPHNYSAGADGSTGRARRPEEEAASWFTDGAGTLKHPTQMRDAMGRQRYAALVDGLRAFYEPMHAVLPLPRVVAKYGVRGSLLIPLCRQLAMSLAEPERRRQTVTVLPGLILGLANGRAPGSMGLPDEHVTRVMLVAELFLGAGQETGNTDLAYLAVQLLRANSIAVPFTFQKQMTNVFAAAARIETDWQMRATGQLVEAFPKWLDYFRAVQTSNWAAWQRQQGTKAAPTVAVPSIGEAANATASTQRGSGLCKGTTAAAAAEAGGDSSQHHYFTSRRPEEVQRVVALERNIEEAVMSRGATLAAAAAKRRRGRSSAEELQVGPRAVRSEEVEADPSRVPDEVGITGALDETLELVKARDMNKAVWPPVIASWENG